VQKLAGIALHAQISQPMAAHDRAKTGIVLGTGHVGSVGPVVVVAAVVLLLVGTSTRGVGVVCVVWIIVVVVVVVVIDGVRKDTARLAIRKRVERLRNSVLEGVVLKVVFDRIDRQRIRLQNRRHDRFNQQLLAGVLSKRIAVL